MRRSEPPSLFRSVSVMDFASVGGWGSVVVVAVVVVVVVVVVLGFKQWKWRNGL